MLDNLVVKSSVFPFSIVGGANSPIQSKPQVSSISIPGRYYSVRNYDMDVERLESAITWRSAEIKEFEYSVLTSIKARHADKIAQCRLYWFGKDNPALKEAIEECTIELQQAKKWFRYSYKVERLNTLKTLYKNKLYWKEEYERKHGFKPRG